MIHLLPLGSVAAESLWTAARTVRALFGCHCEILPEVALPAFAYRPGRQQYDADELLDFLFDRLPMGVLRLVGLTEADLFAEGRNFVFGYAHLRDRVAVCSLTRLHERYWRRPNNDELMRSRLDKALAHELGHTFHVPHCDNDKCVMHQVEFLWQLDELCPLYCDYCLRRTQTVASRPPSHPRVLFELAGSYMRRKRFEQAAATYAAAAASDPRNSAYHNDLGVALLAAGDKAGAARALRRSIELSPETAHPYYNLGIISYEEHDFVAADRYFSEALQRDDDPRTGARYLGVLHQDYFGDAERARHYLRTCVSLGGGDSDVRRRLTVLETSRLLGNRDSDS
ncbi:MAG: tetratricopeptide repeat protein [Pseudomonadota bacterium]